MPVLRWVVLAIAILPIAYYLTATYCAWDFFRRRRDPSKDFAPPVSLLKPLKGLEPEAYENLSSFCRLEYPSYEILFAVDDESDPAVPVIEKLIRDFPTVPIRVLTGTSIPAANNKVAKLCRLLPEARHDVLVMSDGDIRVKPDYLRQVVAPFRDPAVGAVTCLYRGMTDSNLWSELEDLSLTTDWLASTLVARKYEGVAFALGATIAVTQARVADMGGFEALADCAADDYELGRRIATLGYRVELVPSEIQTHCTSRTARQFLLHHLRWGVVIRNCRPWGNAALLFTKGLFWSLAAALLAPSRLAAFACLTIPLAARLAMAFTFGCYGMKDPVVRKKWWLIPFRDSLELIIWVAAWFSNTIIWRGSRYYVRHGRLIRVSSPAAIAPRSSVRVKPGQESGTPISPR